MDRNTLLYYSLKGLYLLNKADTRTEQKGGYNDVHDR